MPGIRRPSAIGSIGMVLLGLSSLASSLEAQVGIRSGEAQVLLLARSAPRVSLATVGPVRRIGQQGQIVQASTALHFSANTGYRILVRAAGPSTSRLWVQAADGEYRELSGAGAVTVARESRGGGNGQSEVHYRIELLQGRAPSLTLPVRYEIVIDPVI